MTKREHKLKQALEISHLNKRVLYYSQPLSIIKSDKKKLLSSSFELRVSGIKGSVYGEFDYKELIAFLQLRVRNEKANLNKLLK